MPFNVSTPTYWERPDRLHALLRDIDRNEQLRERARNEATPELAQRAREITAIFPHMKPGVVQGLVRGRADDNVVMETAKLAGQQALLDGRYSDPRALNHLPYRSRKPQSPVVNPYPGDIFKSMNMAKDQRSRSRNMLSQVIPDGEYGVLDSLRAQNEDMDRRRVSQLAEPPNQTRTEHLQRPADAMGPPSAGTPELPERAREIIGGETSRQRFLRGDTSIRPERMGGERQRRASQGNEPSFAQAQHLPEGWEDHSRSGRAVDIGWKQSVRGLLTGLATGIEGTKALGTAGMTSLKRHDVTFGEALRQTQLPLATYAMMPAIIDRMKEGDLAEEDIEQGNWVNLFTSMLRDPITSSELDQYLTEDGSELIPWGESARAWVAERETARDYAERFFPDIAEAYRDDEDPYQVFATPGRLLAREYVDPGTTSFDITSGLADLTFNIVADPLAVASGGASRMSRAQALFGADTSMVRALYPNITDAVRSMGGRVGTRPLRTAVDDAATFLNKTNHGRATTHWLTETVEPREIWRGFHKKIDYRTANELAKATDATTVKNIFLSAVEGKSYSTGEALARRIRETPGASGMLTGPISRAFGDLMTTGNAGRALGISAGVKSHGSPIRFFSRAPMVGGMDIGKNPGKGLENLERNMINAKLDNDIINRVTRHYMEAEGQIGRQHAVFEGLGEIGTHIANIQRKAIPDNVSPSRLRELNAHNERVDQFAHRLSRAYESEYENLRLYFADADTGMPAKFAGARNEHEEAIAVGGMISEVLNTNIPNPDWRQIRQQTSGIRHVLQNATPESIGHGAWNTFTNIGEKTFVRLWQPLQLFRSAWLARVTLEEMGRMSVNGLAGMGNHPATYIMSVLGGLPSTPLAITGPVSAVRSGARAVGSRFGRYQNTAGMGTRYGDADFPNSSDVADALAEGLNKKQNAWLFQGSNTPGHHSMVPIQIRDGGGRISEAGSEAFARQLHRMANDPVMRRLAGNVSEDDIASVRRVFDHEFSPSSFDAVEEMFWEGSLRTYRLALARASGPRKLSPDEAAHYNDVARTYGYANFEDALTDSRQFARDFLRGHNDARLTELTGADSTLLDLIGNGRISFRYQGNDVTMDVGRIEPHRKGVHKAAWDELKSTINQRIDALGDSAPRIVPGTRDLVDNAVARRAGEMGDRFVNGIMDYVFIKPNDFLIRSPTLRQFNWQSAEEWLPFATREVQQAVLENARVARIPRAQRARLKRIADEQGPGNTIIDNQTFDQVTLNDAVEWTKDLLYDVADRGQYADIMRITNPFLEAFREVYKHWGVVLARHPRYIQRAQQAYKGMKGSGAIYEDERSGQDRFVYQGANIPANLALNMVNGQLGDELRTIASGTVAGVNLIAQTILPTFGPAVTLPARAIPDAVFNRHEWLRDVIFPFGEDETIDSAFIPAWMQNFYALWRDDPSQSQVYQGLRGRVTQALVSTGEYTGNEQGMITEREAEELQRDVDKIAGRLMIIRGVQQFFFPTGPDYDFEVKSPRDAVYYGLGEISKEFQDIQDEQDGDYEAATEEFINRFGWDFLGALMPRSQSPFARPFTTTDQIRWGNENPEFTNAHPSSAGWFAPNPHTDDWELEAFFNDAFGPDRRELDAQERVLLRNNVIGHTILRQEELRAETMFPDEERMQQRYLSEFRGLIMKDYPGFGQTVVGALDRPGIEDQFRDLRRAVENPHLPSDNQVARALKEFLLLYDDMQQFSIEQGYAGRDDRGLLGSNEMAPARDELEMFARYLSEDVPEFGAVTEGILIPLLNLHSDEDRDERSIREEVDPSRIPALTQQHFAPDETDTPRIPPSIERWEWN